MEVIDTWNREVILNSYIIQPIVVDTYSHRAIFLFHEKDRCTKGAT